MLRPVGIADYKMPSDAVGVVLNDRYGSFAAGPHLRPWTSAFAPKGDVPGEEVSVLVSAAFGHSRTLPALNRRTNAVLPQPVTGHRHKTFRAI